MHIDICGLNFRLTDAIARHIQRRVRLALGWASDSVAGAMVRVGDTNGHRGGVDKCCHIVVWLRSRRTLSGRAVDRDLYAAVDGAAARLRRSLRKELGRRRTLERESGILRPLRLDGRARV
jgi:ribosome-associated translation inhibitor RaiA